MLTLCTLTQTQEGGRLLLAPVAAAKRARVWAGKRGGAQRALTWDDPFNSMRLRCGEPTRGDGARAILSRGSAAGNGQNCWEKRHP